MGSSATSIWSRSTEAWDSAIDACCRAGRCASRSARSRARVRSASWAGRRRGWCSADAGVLGCRAPRASFFVPLREPSALRLLAGGEALPLAELSGERVGLLAAVARPDSVRRTLVQLGAQVVAERLFPDHHRFAASDLAGLAHQATRWITTEKDAVKLVPAWTGRARIDVLAIELAVDAPDALLDWLEARLR